MQRLAQIKTWLHDLCSAQPFDIAPASSDASFRRYFRVQFADGATRIVMDAPPPQEDCRPWLKINQLFAAAGCHVPEVLAEDVERGFLLLSDLGNTTYLAALTDADNTPARTRVLYEDATTALVSLQLASRPGVLPEYDRELLLRELMLFPEWYVARHLNIELTPAQRSVMLDAFERILARNLAEPQVFVHRDYHSRNLMCQPPDTLNPGIIDFQDAVHGPISYDLVSLFKDAYIRWDEELTLDWLIGYWEKARAAGLPVRADFGEFHRDYEWMGVQRHLKVLGIFARLYHRDGKQNYLQDMPLVMDYLRQTLDRYRELGPLLKLIDELGGRQTAVGYTF